MDFIADRFIFCKHILFWREMTKLTSFIFLFSNQWWWITLCLRVGSSLRCAVINCRPRHGKRTHSHGSKCRCFPSTWSGNPRVRGWWFQHKNLDVQKQEELSTLYWGENAWGRVRGVETFAAGQMWHRQWPFSTGPSYLLLLHEEQQIEMILKMFLCFLLLLLLPNFVLFLFMEYVVCTNLKTFFVLLSMNHILLYPLHSDTYYSMTQASVNL